MTGEYDGVFVAMFQKHMGGNVNMEQFSLFIGFLGIIASQ